MAGIFENLGVLKDGKLTPQGKKAIIQRHRDILSKGGEKSPYPCDSGKNIPPVPPEHALPDDIEDESKYPDYHKDVLGAYEKVLVALNQNGNFSLPPPFIDPTALAQALAPPPGQEEPPQEFVEIDPEILAGLDPDGFVTQTAQERSNPDVSMVFDPGIFPVIAGPAGPAVLASMINVNPVELANKLALPPSDPNAIIKPPIPKVELPIPLAGSAEYLAINSNISRPVPAPGFNVAFPDKIEFDSWQLKLPKLFLEILNQLLSSPNNIFKLVSPEPEPCFIINAIENLGLFGSPEPGASARTSYQKDLSVFTGQAQAISTVGMLIGDGGKKGATGLLATKFKFDVVEEERVEAPTGDYKIIDVPSGGEGEEWVDDGQTILYVPGIEFTTSGYRQAHIEVSKLLGINPDWLAVVIAKESAYTFAPNILHGGKRYPQYKDGAAIGLIQFTTYDKSNKWKIEKYGSMTAEQQMRGPVYQYYKPSAGKIKSIGSLYVINAGIGNMVWDSNAPEGSKSRLYYYGNPSLDVLLPKGIITHEDVRHVITTKYQGYLAKRKRITISGKIINV